MPAHADIPVILIAFTRQIVARDALFRVVPRNRHAVWHNGRDVLALLKAEPRIFKVRCLRPSEGADRPRLARPAQRARRTTATELRGRPATDQADMPIMHTLAEHFV